MGGIPSKIEEELIEATCNKKLVYTQTEVMCGVPEMCRSTPLVYSEMVLCLVFFQFTVDIVDTI